MFILKSTHDRLTKTLVEQYEARISEIKNRVEDLSRMVFMPTPTQIETLPIRTANAILDGAEVMPQDDAAKEAEMREANRILSGEYSNSEDAW